MDKYEFVRQLNSFLKGKVSDQELSDTILYYQDYIDSEIKKGKSEAQVIEELGSPRLLAKSIIQTKGINNTTEMYEDMEQSYEEKAKRVHIGRVNLPLWLALVILLVIMILLAALVLHVVVLLAPVILVVVAAVFVYKLISDI